MDDTQESARLQAHERLIEILVFILAEMRKHQQIADIDLNQLSQRGFSQTEISTAFSWLFDKMALTGQEVTPGSELPKSLLKGREPQQGSIRIYHEVERSVLTPESQGYLLQLRELGLMSSAEMESVIDRIMMMGIAPVEIGEVKELVAGLLFEGDDPGRAGGRVMLNASDTIQ